MSDDVESSPAQMLHVKATNEHPPRRDGRPVTAPQVTVQVIGLEPGHVRVVERRTNGGDPAVFVELAGDNCKVTLVGRLYRLQQVMAEVVHQLQQLEEVHRTAGGQ
jgi:hypothetical protein